MARTAVGDWAAISFPISLARSSSRSCGTTSATIPAARARSAETRSALPDRAIWVTAKNEVLAAIWSISGPLTWPCETCGSVNQACSEAMAMSASARKFSAPPTHSPLTATMTGTSRQRPGQKSSAWTPMSDRGRVPVVRSAMSAPAENARPAPVTMTQRTPESARTFGQNSASSNWSARLSALSRSGRLRVTMSSASSLSQRNVAGVPSVGASSSIGSFPRGRLERYCLSTR